MPSTYLLRSGMHSACLHRAPSETEKAGAGWAGGGGCECTLQGIWMVCVICLECLLDSDVLPTRVKEQGRKASGPLRLRKNFLVVLDSRGVLLEALGG